MGSPAAAVPPPASGGGGLAEKTMGTKLALKGRNGVKGNLRAESIMSQGGLTVGKDVETEKFIAQGSVRICGRLSAVIVEMEIKGLCRIKEICAEEILVRNRWTDFPGAKLLSYFLGVRRAPGKLLAGRIMGGDIYLEYAEAELVRGINVKLGPQCRIREVYYEESLDLDPAALVQDITKEITTVCRGRQP